MNTNDILNSLHNIVKGLIIEDDLINEHIINGVIDYKALYNYIFLSAQNMDKLWDYSFNDIVDEFVLQYKQ